MHQILPYTSLSFIVFVSMINSLFLPYYSMSPFCLGGGSALTVYDPESASQSQSQSRGMGAEVRETDWLMIIFYCIPTSILFILLFGSAVEINIISYHSLRRISCDAIDFILLYNVANLISPSHTPYSATYCDCRLAHCPHSHYYIRWQRWWDWLWQCWERET